MTAPQLTLPANRYAGNNTRQPTRLCGHVGRGACWQEWTTLHAHVCHFFLSVPVRKIAMTETFGLAVNVATVIDLLVLRSQRIDSPALVRCRNDLGIGSVSFVIFLNYIHV
jgi:hypothetical protein